MWRTGKIQIIDDRAGTPVPVDTLIGTCLHLRHRIDRCLQARAQIVEVRQLQRAEKDFCLRDGAEQSGHLAYTPLECLGGKRGHGRIEAPRTLPNSPRTSSATSCRRFAGSRIPDTVSEVSLRHEVNHLQPLAAQDLRRRDVPGKMVAFFAEWTAFIDGNHHCVIVVDVLVSIQATGKGVPRILIAWLSRRLRSCERIKWCDVAEIFGAGSRRSDFPSTVRAARRPTRADSGVAHQFCLPPVELGSMRWPTVPARCVT